MKFSDLQFGFPEAEHDEAALREAFYESPAWRQAVGPRPLPFLVGRKGAGKSAIARKLELRSRERQDASFLRVIPADFRHVEVRQLLAKLLGVETSWQYVYAMVWEGCMLGQIARHMRAPENRAFYYSTSKELAQAATEFATEAPYYVSTIADALVDVLLKLTESPGVTSHGPALAALRKRLHPESLKRFREALQREPTPDHHTSEKLIICIDGLDDHWDTEPPSLHFLAQALRVANDLSHIPWIQVLVCLREGIFRSLVDTATIEYDKFEARVSYLSWTSKSLYEMVSLRAFPKAPPGHATRLLTSLLPGNVDSRPIDDYLGEYLLRRPRDYVSFFSHLAADSGSHDRIPVEVIREAIGWYCSKRLVDLHNEFALIYPRIDLVVERLALLPRQFRRDDLVAFLDAEIRNPRLASAAVVLLRTYGDPTRLAKILLSIGALGFSSRGSGPLEFIQEYSETRVASLWGSGVRFGLHPVYRYAMGLRDDPDIEQPESDLRPISLSDYVPSEHGPESLPKIGDEERATVDIVKAMGRVIAPGNAGSTAFESWVDDALRLCFPENLQNPKSQTPAGQKRFEHTYTLHGSEYPWNEFLVRARFPRIYVECKNRREVDVDTGDVAKIVRDMDSLDLGMSLLVYNDPGREPHAELLRRLRAVYNESKRAKVILPISSGLIFAFIDRNTPERRRELLSHHWRSHIEKWLAQD